MPIVGAVVLLGLLFIGAPIFAVLVGTGAFGAMLSRGLPDIGGQVSTIIDQGLSEKSTVLSTIPLFILAGYFLAASKTAERLVKASQAGLGWMPGSLAIVTILACAIFTTFTGASGVTIVALGGLLMPALSQQNYPEKFSFGLIGGTGSVGLLFPPALPLFIYGTVFGFVYQTTSDTGVGAMELVDWDTKRFIFAGIVPGSILVCIIAAYAVFQARRHGVKTDWSFSKAKKEFGPAFLRVLPEMAIPFLVIIAIIKGVTIPQAAALTVVYVFVIEMFLYRDLKFSMLPKIFRDSMGLIGAIFIIIFAASGFSNWLVTEKIPQALLEWVTQTFDSKVSFLLALNVVLLFVGMTMDIFSAIVVVVPLITPAAMSFGIDPYHLGVIFLLNLEIGYLTPPVGLNLFITSHTFKKPIDEVVRATFPFLVCMVIALGLVTYIPALTVYPDAERRGRVAEFHTRVQAAVRKATSIQELQVDGKTLNITECAAISDELKKSECTGLFEDVTNCRKDADLTKRADCEKQAIAEYAGADDIDDDDDDDFDTDEDTDDTDKNTDDSDDDWEDDTETSSDEILNEEDAGSGDTAGKDEDDDEWDVD